MINSNNFKNGIVTNEITSEYPILFATKAEQSFRNIATSINYTPSGITLLNGPMGVSSRLSNSTGTGIQKALAPPYTFILHLCVKARPTSSVFSVGALTGSLGGTLYGFNASGFNFSVMMRKAFGTSISYNSSVQPQANTDYLLIVTLNSTASEARFYVHDFRTRILTTDVSTADYSAVAYDDIIGVTLGNTGSSSDMSSYYFAVISSYFGLEDVKKLIEDPTQIFYKNKVVVPTSTGFPTGPRIHYVVYPASVTATPQQDDIVKGWPGTGITSNWQSISIDSQDLTFTVDASGLTASTNYKVAYVWYDGLNYSNVSILDFATISGGGGSYTFNIAVGTYTISSVNPEVIAQRQLPITPSSYAYTDADPILYLYRVISGNTGVYNVSGVDPNLLASRLLQITPNSYNISGISSDLLTRRLIDANPGSYNDSGADPSLIVRRLLDTVMGTYNVSGVNPETLASRKLDASAGSYTMSASDAATLVQRLLSANPGSFSYSEQNPATQANRLLPSTEGSYSLTGVALTFDTGSTGAFSIDVGSYGMTGFPVTLLASRILSASPGAYNDSGSAASLFYNRLLDIVSASYTIASSNPTTLASRKLDAEAGSYNETGVNNEMLAQRKLDASAGSYSVSGITSSLVASRLVDVAQGTYNLSGAVTTLVTSRRLPVTPGSYSSAGTPITFVFVPVGGSITYPDTQDVRAGLLYGPGNSMVGTWKFNTSLSADKAESVSPNINYIVIGTYGVSGSLPNASDVRKGVQYGLFGTQFTGTAIGFVSLDTSTAVIIKPITEKLVLTL